MRFVGLKTLTKPLLEVPGRHLFLDSLNLECGGVWVWGVGRTEVKSSTPHFGVSGVFLSSYFLKPPIPQFRFV